MDLCFLCWTLPDFLFMLSPEACSSTVLFVHLSSDRMLSNWLYPRSISFSLSTLPVFESGTYFLLLRYEVRWCEVFHLFVARRWGPFVRYSALLEVGHWPCNAHHDALCIPHVYHVVPWYTWWYRLQKYMYHDKRGYHGIVRAGLSTLTIPVWDAA